ncbi:uncharacterized protein LOC124812680 [Hydra vulgaris]|uniref:uncharacterized protein LOC124812680 n=1 Tax=Hydra vulgaris TaxID=6087 RepID=UPI001F5F9B1A|nr:uncharacterized protein LOC124812680 [Hydra vulgaris]
MPRARPSAQTFIVEPNEILEPEVILLENRTFFEIASVGGEPMSVFKWLAKRRLLKNSVYCMQCGISFGLNAYKNATDAYRWFCKNCKKRQSVCDGSFFSKSRLPLRQLLLYIYSWRQNAPQQDIQHETEIHRSATLADWGNFCRDVCKVDIKGNPQIIGGIKIDRTPIIVEIDKSKFFHLEVPDRTSRTLKGFIIQHILPGSHIVLDGWVSYAGIENIGEGIYSHEVITHERHFVDPQNNDIHTQNVENMWMRLERKIRQQFGTSETLFESRLHEFVWRQRYKNNSKFSAFTYCVNRQYLREI